MMTTAVLKQKSILKLKNNPTAKIPNAETIKVIREAEAGINTTRYTNSDAFFKAFLEK